MVALAPCLALRRGIIAISAISRILAALMQKLGIPGDVGMCVTCFEQGIGGC
jgi:hypothetical protein